MKRFLSIFLLSIIGFLFSCHREIDETPMQMGFDYQPLEVGLFWRYEVEEVLHFGENDSESSSFFIEDLISDYYSNEAGEKVFIVQRSKSANQVDWEKVELYTLIQRDFTLIKTIHNQPIVSLVFPPNPGVTWNGNAYRKSPEDNFDLIIEGSTVRVNQEESDDEITYRDIRYEVYERGVGLIEKYDEVLTYCSRNDCLGDQLINSGYKRHLKMVSNGEK